MQTTSPSRLRLAAVLLCFFFSGAAGLIYQVAWGKALGLVFGNTVYAIATVLAVFMGGLAVGSAVLGRWSERRANPVALYGWVELGVAATGALSLLGIAGVRQLYVETFHAVAGSPWALVALRFFGAALVLFLPTFLMGGTLPILVRGLTRQSAELGQRIGRLYWVNTAGAVGGTLVAGFLLLPAVGLRLTVAVAVTLNVLAGVIALLAGRGFSVSATASEAPAQTPDVQPGAKAGAPVFLLVMFGAVGATAIAHEVCWTRLLATVVGSSTYAFTLMLGTFLAGIVLGSMVFESWVKRKPEVTLSTFAATQTWTAIAALAFLASLRHLPQLVPPLLRATDQSFAGLVLVQFVMSAFAMLPAATVFGFNFPVVTLLVAGRPEASGRYAAAVGRAYAANTLGAIAGATLAGFWLLPWLGSFRTVALMAMVNFSLAALLHLRRERRSLVSAVLNVALVVVVATVSGRFYNRDLATFSTFLYWDLYNTRMTLAEMAATTEVVFAEDGLNASITVVRAEDYVGLRTNGKVDASNHDIATQLLLGHLGASFHPAPRRVLLIGFGSGMSLAGLARYPEIERIDCVEIEPAVIRAARHLESLNRGVLRDPRVRIFTDDGRNFLLTTREKYDLIVSEPSNPWIAGVSALFTDEFYREARARLNPGGMVVQWVQAYSLYPQDFRMVLGTFARNFPSVSLWRAEASDYFLLAQTEPRPLTLDRLRGLWSNDGLREDFQRLGMAEPEGLIAFHRLDDVDLRKLVAGAAVNTDDHTRLEYNAPRALLVAHIEDQNRQLVWDHRSSPLPRDVKLDNPDLALLAAAESLLKIEEDAEAQRYLDALDDRPPTARLEIARARLNLIQRHYTAARATFRDALRMDRNSLEAAHGMGEAARKLLDFDSANLLFRQVVSRDPGYIPALESLAGLARARARWEEAAEWQTRLMAVRHPTPKDFAEMGEILMTTGETEGAVTMFEQALALEPYSYTAHANLGAIYHAREEWERARPHLEQVMRFSPDSDVSNYRLLYQVYRKLGREADAQATLRKARRIFPETSDRIDKEE